MSHYNCCYFKKKNTTGRSWSSLSADLCLLPVPYAYLDPGPPGARRSWLSLSGRKDKAKNYIEEMIAEPETQSEPVPHLTRISAYQAVSLHLFPSRVRGSLGTTGRDVSLCAKGRRGRVERFKNFSLPSFGKTR